MVIMNPPFTRATNHGGAHANVVNPAFAAFNASKSDMDSMGKRMRELGKNSCYDGKAGLASAFVALADRKLKRGGILAFVLPVVAATGASWIKFREMLAKKYIDLSIVSIAAANINDISFSADTGLGECLIIARKSESETTSDVRFVSLVSRPTGFAQANEVAKRINHSINVRRISDGPFGGTPINIGMSNMGEMVANKSKIQALGLDFRFLNAIRTHDYSIVQVASALSESTLWLPSQEALQLKTTRLGDIAQRGLVDRLITGPPYPAPFTRESPSSTATYPCLWSHNAKNETRIILNPDSQLRVQNGMEARASEIWKTSSRSHISRGFRFNTQPCSVAFTEKNSMGGRAWPNVKFTDTKIDYAFAIWGNSTLGLLCYWWHSSRQDSGRGDITVSAIDSLPVLDLRALSDEQLETAKDIFEEFREKELKPAYLADADANRALLDKRVVCDLLGFGRETYEGVRRLSAKWCAEPSVHGGKRRPRGAGLVM